MFKPALLKKFESRSLQDQEAYLREAERLHSEVSHFANHYQLSQSNVHQTSAVMRKSKRKCKQTMSHIESINFAQFM